MIKFVYCILFLTLMGCSEDHDHLDNVDFRDKKITAVMYYVSSVEMPFAPISIYGIKKKYWCKVELSSSEIERRGEIVGKLLKRIKKKADYKFNHFDNRIYYEVFIDKEKVLSVGIGFPRKYMIVNNEVFVFDPLYYEFIEKYTPKRDFVEKIMWWFH